MSEKTKNQTVPVVAKRRFEELDLARSLPLLFLPLGHIYEEFSYIKALPENLVSNYSWILNLGCLVPSIFMILMGANIHLSRKSTAENLFKRGIILLVMGVALNFFRIIFPFIIVSIIHGNLKEIIGESSSLYFTLTSDIYDFAGLAFIVFAFFKKFDFSRLAIILSSIVLLTLDVVIPQFSTGSKYLDGFLGRFIYMNEDSYFPLSTWLVFPAIGYYFGYFYNNFETEDIRKSFVKKTFWVSLVGVFAMWFSLTNYKLDALTIITSPANEYITDLPNVIMLTLLDGIWFAMFYFIYFKMKDTKICKFLVKISKLIIPFYIAQWIIIGWTEYFVKDFIEGAWIGHGLFWTFTIVTTIISAIIAIIYNKIKENQRLNAVQS